MKKLERNGRTFFVRSGSGNWVMVGENVDGKLRWIHVIDEAAARQWIWQKLGGAGLPIASEDFELI